MTIQIGQLSNVPAPGDDIRSPWAQDVTRLGIHTFATVAALHAATPTWVGLANGAFAVTLDDGLLYQRQAGQWRRQWSEPWGLVGYTALSGQANNAGGILTGTISLTVVANRRYRVEAQLGIYTAGDVGNNTFHIRRDGNSIGRYMVKTGTTPDYAACSFFTIDAPAAGARIYDVYYVAPTATARGIDPTLATPHLMVWDMGFAGAPVVTALDDSPELAAGMGLIDPATGEPFAPIAELPEPVPVPAPT